MQRRADRVGPSRVAGVVLPLFSLRTQDDWGVGQILDLPRAAAWLRASGHTLLQVLPPYELADGETSPYGARTAFGLDPIYITVEAVPEVDAALIDDVLGREGHALLSRLREAPQVDYRAVRALKGRVLNAAFRRFIEQEWERGTPRAAALRAFIREEHGWLDDLALYVAIRDSHAGYGWTTWPEGERDRSETALREARVAHAGKMLEYAYLQWVALSQWQAARKELAALGVELMGDLPFVVCNESADVWARAGQFQRALSLGAPPDAFAPDGQDWGLPPYDWAAMEQDDLAWVRARTRHAARLYDRFRLDHVVGYFRMWVRAFGERGRFDPDGEEAQRHRGERVLRAVLEEAAAAKVIGEDLGVIPPFVREVLTTLGIPGYRVIPWERDEHHRLRAPSHFPDVSVATWSTHDTAPITSWWDEFQEYERADLAQLARVDRGAPDDERTLAMLKTLFESGSDLTLVLVQELLGERARINTPGTVGEQNWTYRLPRPIEELEADAHMAARFDRVRQMVSASGRT
jgi:4-alpha-glucanotransferase